MEKEEDILLKEKGDRRMLSHVPDATKVRTHIDRRNTGEYDEDDDMEQYIADTKAGIRYEVDFDVVIKVKTEDGDRDVIYGRAIDMSTTGILIESSERDWVDVVKNARKIKLQFVIPAGTMPEGLEMKVNIPAHMVREIRTSNRSMQKAGFAFDKSLAEYSLRHKDAYMLTMSSILIFAISLIVMLMRAESIIFFKFNKWLYLYSLVSATFLLSRYFIGALYRPVKIDPDYTPGVSIIIPCFNEEEWISRTILSCVNQDYPIDKLEVIVVDDCSNDNSVAVINETLKKLAEEDGRYHTVDRVKFLPQKVNRGKRDVLCEGIKIARHELVVFVDSDSFLDPFAIRCLVQPFQDPQMGGCAGRCDVANTYTNYITKMQSVRYYIAFRVMKAAEGYFDTVTCLSGPLACYRKEIVEDNMEAWLNQKFLGQKATFGDDRSMTNMVLKEYRTGYQDTAYCSTIVPNDNKVFLKQQMRWKRSWLRESFVAGSFIWKKEPFSAVFFYIGLMVPMLAPIVVIYNLIYVPIVHRVFPTTFIIGLILMSALMSMVQLLLRRSSTWFYGIVFCLYYEAILLWQMPIAWVTFWKSTWGTRRTPADIEEEERRKIKEKEHDRKQE